MRTANITKDREIEIQCYSVQDEKFHRAKVKADTFGRLSFKMLE